MGFGHWSFSEGCPTMPQNAPLFSSPLWRISNLQFPISNPLFCTCGPCYTPATLCYTSATKCYTLLHPRYTPPVARKCPKSPPCLHLSRCASPPMLHLLKITWPWRPLLAAISSAPSTTCVSATRLLTPATCSTLPRRHGHPHQCPQTCAHEPAHLPTS